MGLKHNSEYSVDTVDVKGLVTVGCVMCRLKCRSHGRVPVDYGGGGSNIKSSIVNSQLIRTGGGGNGGFLAESLFIVMKTLIGDVAVLGNRTGGGEKAGFLAKSLRIARESCSEMWRCWESALAGVKRRVFWRNHYALRVSHARRGGGGQKVRFWAGNAGIRGDGSFLRKKKSSLKKAKG